LPVSIILFLRDTGKMGLHTLLRFYMELFFYATECKTGDKIFL